MTLPQSAPAVDSASAGAITVVFGASGYIGSNLVPHLIAAGHRVRAVARQSRVLEARDWQGVELVAADALIPDTLAAALEGCWRRFLPRAFDGGRRQLRPARPSGRAQLCPRRRTCGRAADRLSGRTGAGRRRLRAPDVAPGKRRHAAIHARAGDRDTCRHHRRRGFRGLRSDARPGVSPAGDGRAQVGSFEIFADRPTRTSCTTCWRWRRNQRRPAASSMLAVRNC